MSKPADLAHPDHVSQKAAAVTLNRKQQEAVEYINGPSIILAGAGSGKTRVLIHKVHELMKHGVDPSEIIMITFTNKAAKEMKERMGSTVLGYVGTFHTLCARILRQNGMAIGIPPSYLIYDDDDQLQLLKSIVKNTPTKYTPTYFRHRISAAKNEMIPPSKYLEIFGDYAANVTFEVYKAYQDELKKNDALDFDDLLLKVLELFMTKPSILEKYQRMFTYIMIDEFQDTNVVQYKLAQLLAQKNRNITIVGDFSQSIYSWRGADIRNLEKFEKDFEGSKVFKLEENYRSSQHILDFAFNVISQNTLHPILHLQTKNKHGEEVYIYEADDEQDEAFFIISEIEKYRDRLESFAILYRTNAQSRVLEEALLHTGFPYVLVGGTRFYERKEVKDIISYLRLFCNPNDKASLERIKKLGKKRFEKFKELFSEIDEPSKFETVDLMEKVFNKTDYLSLYDPHNEEDYARLENIKELKSVALGFPNLYEFLEQIMLVESEYSQHEKDLSKKSDEKSNETNNYSVKLMTLHQAKGLEFDCVFIVGLEEGLLPHAKSVEDQFSLEEERRLYYVGITRAKKKLYITHARRRFIFGRRGETLTSRFLENT